MKKIKNQSVKERTGIIGSSQIASILGITGAFKSEFETWQDFTGQSKDVDNNSEAMLAGTCLEDGIAKMFESKYKIKLKKLAKDSAWQHEKYDWAICHPDRIIDTKTALEIKLVSSYKSHDWGEEETDEIPQYYLTQVIWYMVVNPKLTRVYVARLTDNKLYRYHVDREGNEELIAKVEEKVVEWVRKIREDGYIPEAKDLKEQYSLISYLGVSSPIELESLSLDIKMCAARYKEAAAQIKEAEGRKEEALREMCNIVGDSKSIKYQGRNIAFYVTTIKENVDVKLLKADHPDIFEKYKKVSESTYLRINARDEDVALTQAELEKIEELKKEKEQNNG